MLCRRAGRCGSWFRADGWKIEVPPLGISKGRAGFEELGEVKVGESEMSPPWIMKFGIKRWKGVLL